MFPTRSSLVKEPEAFAPAVKAFPSAAKRELTPAGSACQQLFSFPESFFSERPALRLPFRRRRSGNLFRFTQLVNSFFQPVRFFSNPAANPSATLRQLEASFYPAPSRAACQQLIFREQKKTTALSLSSLPRRHALLQLELPSRSGEDGLCTSAPFLSTPFLQFFALFFFIQQNHHVILSVFETSHAPSFS